MSPASYQTAPPRDADLLPTRAGNGTRTRDPNLGKVVLYQLSYSRNRAGSQPRRTALPLQRSCAARGPPFGANGGEGDRTPVLVNAIDAHSQLRYAPAIFSPRAPGRGRTPH